MSWIYKIRYLLGKIKKMIVEILYFSAYKLGFSRIKNHSFQRLMALRNKYSGKRCFIVGNAPSLNKMDLTRLHGEHCFVFNGAYEIANIVGPETVFQVVEDRLVFEDHIDKLNSIDHPVFVPSDLSHLVKSKGLIVCPFSRAWPEFLPSWPAFIDLNASKPIFFWGGTVAIFGLQLALWMGFEEI